MEGEEKKINKKNKNHTSQLTRIFELQGSQTEKLIRFPFGLSVLRGDRNTIQGETSRVMGRVRDTNKVTGEGRFSGKGNEEQIVIYQKTGELEMGTDPE